MLLCPFQQRHCCPVGADQQPSPSRCRANPLMRKRLAQLGLEAGQHPEVSLCCFAPSCLAFQQRHCCPAGADQHPPSPSRCRANPLMRKSFAGHPQHPQVSFCCCPAGADQHPPSPSRCLGFEAGHRVFPTVAARECAPRRMVRCNSTANRLLWTHLSIEGWPLPRLHA